MSEHLTSIGSREVAARAQRSADEERAQAGSTFGVMLLLGTLAFITLVVLLSSRAPTVDLSTETLSVRATGFSRSITVASIDSVALMSRLPGIGRKLNGFQFGNVYHGRFAVPPYARANLFVNAVRPPYLLVRSADSVIILNLPDTSATRALFDSLQRRLRSR